MKCNDRSLWQKLALKLQYVWRLAVPFWRFRDAGTGTLEQRVANYRHNRSQRNILPFYMWKWIGIAICMFQIMHDCSRKCESPLRHPLLHECRHRLCVFMHRDCVADEQLRIPQLRKEVGN